MSKRSDWKQWNKPSHPPGPNRDLAALWLQSREIARKLLKRPHRKSEKLPAGIERIIKDLRLCGDDALANKVANRYKLPKSDSGV